MKRPSRGERRSATTTRHCGSFFPPTRVSRMLTAISARQDSETTEMVAGGGAVATSPLTHELSEVGHLALLDAPHELAHLVELLDELVDLLHRRARALGDPQPPRALDQLRVAPLVGRHRQHDRLHAVELLLVHL